MGKKLATGASYPYTSGTTKLRGACKAATPIALNYNSYQETLNKNEARLKELVSAGPVAVAVYASTQAFQNYKSGIFYDATCPTSCGSVNHGKLTYFVQTSIL